MGDDEVSGWLDRGRGRAHEENEKLVAELVNRGMVGRGEAWRVEGWICS